MVKPGIRALIESKAAAYRLDPDLVEAHVLTESSGEPTATRFEPRFYERYVRPLGIKDDNEARGRATSFGLLQIMGQVARELGFQGAFSSLLDPATGLDWGCKKLARCYKRYEKQGIDYGIAAYNAGSAVRVDGVFVNQAYVDKVNGYLKEIKTHA